MMRLQHFIHNHPLTLLSGLDHKEAYCNGCSGKISDEAYCCQDCNFYLHRRCGELETEIEHPLHRQHPLTLQFKQDLPQDLKCWACGLSWGDFFYMCSHCHFGLDLACCLLEPSRSHQIEHPPHDHPLVLCNTTADFPLLCSVCGASFEGGKAWVCLEYCHHLLHTPCLQFMKGVKHPFHSEHLLKLSYCQARPNPGMCHVCGQEAIFIGLSCSECDFILHPKCALLKPSTEPHHNPDLPVQHLGQNHPLLLCHMTINLQLHCSACEHPFDVSMPIYSCSQCSVFLHQSCLEWPAAIKHPFHPQHPLFLLPKPPGIRTYNNPGCSVCQSTIFGCTYQCMAYDCRFSLHLQCAPLLHTINSELHQHLLLFRNPNPRHFLWPCHACETTIGTFFLRSVHNDFKYHFRCCPNILPNTIKHECHQHPLLLTTSQIKDYPDEDDEAELYCDACEDQRKLDEATYYCSQCHYVAHVDCALSELFRAMEDEMPLAWIPRHVLSIDVIKRKIWALDIDVELSEKVGHKDAANSALVLVNEEMEVLRKTIEEKKAEVQELMMELEKLKVKHAQIADILDSTKQDSCLNSLMSDLALDSKLDVKHADMEYSSIEDLMLDLK